MSRLFTSGGQSIGTSASVLPMIKPVHPHQPSLFTGRSDAEAEVCSCVYPKVFSFMTPAQGPPLRRPDRLPAPSDLCVARDWGWGGQRLLLRRAVGGGGFAPGGLE